MFKPVHGLRGTLLEGISAIATSLVLDSASISLLRTRLDTGNHTYALIRNAYAYEVVKITNVQPASITVVRGQDGTTAAIFAPGSQIEFVLGDAAIQDIIEDKMLDEIHLSGSGAAEVTKTGTNSYTVHVPVITLVSESPDILVDGEYPEFVISAPIKSDCCG